MNSLKYPYQLSLLGSDPQVLVEALVETKFAGEGVPSQLMRLATDLPVESWWAELARLPDDLDICWDGPGPPGEISITSNGVVCAQREHVELEPESLVELLEKLPFDTAVVGNRFVDWEDEDVLGEYLGPTLAAGHYPLGLAMALKSDGYGRLVSLQWLDYGPWCLVNRGELALIFFHEVNANAAEALEQARLGHQAMGPGPDGGWVHPNFQFSGELSGLYDAEDHEYVWVLAGRDPEPWELLEHCAVRIQQALGPDKPVERVAVVMPEEDRARRWVHQMWLRDIDLRTFVGGREISLTAGYEPPPPVPPAWVRERSWLRD
jgi:hypothetical protein